MTNPLRSPILGALARVLARVLASVLAASLAACSFPASDARLGLDAPSENASQWRPVANYLGYNCGTLDCHGSGQRNLVIWSCYGLRLSPTDVSGCLRGPLMPSTTAAEYDATYRSLVGLEPNVMSVVVASGGQNPDLLTLIRKARGEENHKGGTILTQGDGGVGTAADTCITSWLGGATNVPACVLALQQSP